MLYSIVRLVVVLIFKIFFRIEVKGRENIPQKGGFILASNHLSLLDPMVLGAACWRKLNFMAKDNLFYNPVFSWLISRLGAFPVKRNSADPSALKEAILRLNKGSGLLIFPEGTRKSNGSISMIQPGIGFLATKSTSPVIPSFIKGTDLVLPKGARFIRPRKISVYFGQEIPIERRQSHTYQDIANAIMCDIGHLGCTD